MTEMQKFALMEAVILTLSTLSKTWPDLGEDRRDPMEDWEGGVVSHRPITLNNIPTIGGGRSGEAWEVPQSMINLGVALLAAAAIWGGAESSARAGGSHAHVLVANYLKLRAEELGIIAPRDNFAQFDNR